MLGADPETVVEPPWEIERHCEHDRRSESSDELIGESERDENGDGTRGDSPYPAQKPVGEGGCEVRVRARDYTGGGVGSGK